MIKRGDIYLAKFNLEGHQKSIERPVIIISNDNVNSYEESILACAVSTVQSSRNSLKLSGLKYGLAKDFFILPTKIFSLNKENLLTKISHLSDNDSNELNRYILEVHGVLKRETSKKSIPGEIEIFKEINISGSPEELENFKLELFRKIENDNNRSLYNNKDFSDFMIVNYQGILNIEDSKIFLKTGTEEYKVTNIIPTVKNKLDFSEYNSILDDFYNNVINPVVKDNGLNLSVIITSGVFTLEELVSDVVVRKLKSFSMAANKSTGFSHPLDQERWFDFIVSSFIEKDIINSEYLGRWFVEIEGWSDDMANELVLNYEYSMDLLNYREKNDGNE